MTPSKDKYIKHTSKRIVLNKADFDLLPDPKKVNVSEWIREAIREKAAREAAQIQKKGR